MSCHSNIGDKLQSQCMAHIFFLCHIAGYASWCWKGDDVPMCGITWQIYCCPRTKYSLSWFGKYTDSEFNRFFLVLNFMNLAVLCNCCVCPVIIVSEFLCKWSIILSQENMTRMLLVTDVQDVIKRHQAQIITSLKDPDIRCSLGLILYIEWFYQWKRMGSFYITCSKPIMRSF